MKRNSFFIVLTIAFSFLLLRYSPFVYKKKDKVSNNYKSVASQKKRKKLPVDTVPKTKTVTIVAVGDVMFDRRVKEAINNNGINWPFADVKPYLNADVTIANLESSLAVKGKPTEGKDVLFQGTPKGVEALRQASINLVSLANNHALDYGLDSLVETRNILKKNKIAFAGAGANKEEAYKGVIVKVSDLKIGFLSFSDIIPLNSLLSDISPGIAPARDSKKVASKIAAFRKNVDILITSFHWGLEYKDYPTAKQKELATAAIDAGADLVLGHHPHVIQGISVYKKKLILYSLGNFLFDRYKTITAESFIFRLSLNNKGEFVKAKILPVFISSSGKPIVARNNKGKRILDRLKKISGNFGLKLKEKPFSLTIENI